MGPEDLDETLKFRAVLRRILQLVAAGAQSRRRCGAEPVQNAQYPGLQCFRILGLSEFLPHQRRNHLRQIQEALLQHTLYAEIRTVDPINLRTLEGALHNSRQCGIDGCCGAAGLRNQKILHIFFPPICRNTLRNINQTCNR